MAHDQTQVSSRKRVILYCDGCKTESVVVLDKEKKVGYCPCCGSTGVVVEKVEWLKHE